MAKADPGPRHQAAVAAAPNVLLVVLDDVGFSDLGCYGSEIATPCIDALAERGLRYVNFHVTAACSPTRACLMSGRNAHAAGVGVIAEWSTQHPGYSGRMHRDLATLPEALHDQSYGTYAIGKWHLTNIADYGSAGPHDDWPLGRGFSRWYGFHGALADQWHPELYEDNHPISEGRGEGLHLSEDLADRAIRDIREHVSAAPDRRFFQYLAFGACHWPHHVPRPYLEAQRGRYEAGWDAVREARIAAQLRLGVVPASTVPAPRNPGIPAWEELPAPERTLSARLQECYAAFLSHTDAQVGRVIDELRALGQLENTLIVLLSDNGASAEGGPAGAINMRKHLVYEKESVAAMLPRIEQIGTENAYNHYAAGWAQVSNAPLKWYKQDAHGGGIRAPLVIHWPARIRQSHALRPQFHHAIDIAPTILAAAGVRMPAEFRGRSQPPLDGVDMGYSFDDAARPARRRTQYFEWAGDRGIWHEGWKAVVRHVKGTDFNLDTWELYHLEEDFSECRDLAGAEPQRLKAMIELWEREAKANAVLPLDDRDIERAHARSAMEPVRSHRYSSSMVRVDRLNAPNVLGRPHEIRARIAPFRAGTQGVLLAWGSRFGGLALYVEADHLVFEYVYSLDERQLLRSTRPVPDGCRQLAVRLVPPAAEPGSATLMLDGGLAGRMVIERFWPPYGVTAGITVGRDGGCPVSERYAAPFPYPGDDWLIEIEIDNNLN